MTEIEVNIVAGPVRVIPIPATFIDVLLINGPCTLHGFSIRDVTNETGLSAQGSVTSPAALAVIASIPVVPAGTYLVNWSVGLRGAAAAGDADNFEITGPGFATLVSDNQGAVGEYPQDQIEVTTTSAGVIAVKAIAAGVVGAIYDAQIAIEPIAFGESIAELQDGNNPLMEMSLGSAEADTRWFGDSGLHVRNRINYHPIAGQITGAVYVRYAKHTY